jgi:hypothetical protein
MCLFMFINIFIEIQYFNYESLANNLFLQGYASFFTYLS